MAPSTASSFTSVPILSLEAGKNPSTKDAFLADLRSALLNTGFLYLSDTGLPPNLIDQVKRQSVLFFDESVLPLAEKEKIEMKNEKSFLGWSRVSIFHFFFAFLKTFQQVQKHGACWSWQLSSNGIQRRLD